MIAKAKVRYIRISPRKVQDVSRLVRGKTVGSVLGMLPYMNKRASLFIEKLVKSAVSNAGNKGVDISDLGNIYVSKINVNQGPVLKRHRAAPFGMAAMIRKRTTHIEIELDYIQER